ncbi:MAG: hypothetical protein AVDCRST_MAG56-7757 [uncultured Cytophagales bacterium]|uniref:ABC transmembrane type-1 domain-containing protein n=1 Tax=uncultured Cytophagales bacterium TaxID=158755 RepID=A0A6J4LPV1_9SPHI|nr:MAG: hypothetical protein AVDCRST_MAG56-7757 [uncultured Cytophagales bacterium]
MLEIVARNIPAFRQGLAVTLQLCGIAWSIGILLGALLGYASAKSRLFNFFNKTFSYLISSIPVLVLLFWFHYPLQYSLDLRIDPFYTSAFILALINTFAVSNVVAAGIANLPRQYLEAATVCGIGKPTAFLRIELPLILRNVFPGILMSQVNILHLTLFASLISVNELFRVAQRVNAQVYRPVEIYTALALFFLLISLPLILLSNYLTKKYARDLSEK